MIIVAFGGAIKKDATMIIQKRLSHERLFLPRPAAFRQIAKAAANPSLSLGAALSIRSPCAGWRSDATAEHVGAKRPWAKPVPGNVRTDAGALGRLT
ncbi:MAG: hypothetical protein R3229_14745 [Alphaproteobacteria bacterium]|nr:hypothetical protein [Alphaproteobacteria bacterium]